MLIWRNLPIQLRLPNEKGMYAHGCLLTTSSCKNLSGMNLNGSDQYFLFVCVSRMPKTTDVPPGTMWSPEIGEIHVTMKFVLIYMFRNEEIEKML